MKIVDEVLHSGRCFLVARDFVLPGDAALLGRIRIVRKRLRHLADNVWIRIVPTTDGGTPRELVPNLKRISEVPAEARAK